MRHQLQYILKVTYISCIHRLVSVERLINPGPSYCLTFILIESVTNGLRAINDSANNFKYTESTDNHNTQPPKFTPINTPEDGIY